MTSPAYRRSIVRTLVDALSPSIAESSPDAVVHWSRMVRHAHSAAVVAAVIETACEAVEEIAYAEHGDLATMVVFLEIVKSRATGRDREHVPAPSEAKDSALTAIESLLAMLSVRDEATCTHSRATGEWGRRIATRMGLIRRSRSASSKPASCTTSEKFACPTASCSSRRPSTQASGRS